MFRELQIEWNGPALDLKHIQSLRYKSIKFKRAYSLLRFSREKFTCTYSEHWIPPLYGYRRSFLFSRIFWNKEAILGKNKTKQTKQNKQNKTKTKNLTTFLSLLLGSSDRHMRIVIFRSISHHSLGLKRSRSQTLFRGEHLFVDGTHKTVSKQKDIK